MKIQTLADADAVAKEAARLIAVESRTSVAARGRFIIAVSGGKTPWQMLRALASEDVPWNSLHVVQVDERIASGGGPDRNLTHLRESLEHAPLTPERIYAMPVEEADLEAGTQKYARKLQEPARRRFSISLTSGLDPMDTQHPSFQTTPSSMWSTATSP